MNAKIIAFRRGFETNASLITSLPFGSNTAGRDDVLRAMQQSGFEVPPTSEMQPLVEILTGTDAERFVRVDAVNETDAYSFGHDGLVDVLMFYREPMPSAALSLELAVDLHFVGNRARKPWGGGRFAGTRNLLCRSHAERLRMAEYLAHSKGGILEIEGGAMYDVTGMRLVDRTVVYASRRGLRRSNIGSPVALDRDFTDELRPIMEELAPTEVKIDVVGVDIVNVDQFGVDATSIEAARIKARKVY